MGGNIYRSKENKVISGVCGGFAEYLDLDPTIVRVIWALTSLTWGAGIIAYIICAIIIPEKPSFLNNHNSESSYSSSDPNKNKLALGIVLIVIGSILLARRFFIWFDMSYLWPTLLIAAGIYILIRRRDEN
jgi:phage shock protein PspC (stress-responsive transcriptional regulator)